MDITDDLNPAQLAAVAHHAGPLLLLAGAGSGKTRVITYRLVELLHRGVDAERILAVTFTNKAAGEMRARTQQLLAASMPDGAVLGVPTPRWIGTFHAVGARLLRRLAGRLELPADFVILDEDDQLKLCKDLCKEQNISELVMTPRTLRAAIDRAKNQGIMATAYQGHDYFTDLVQKLYPAYQQRLKQLGAVDFGDLLLLPVALCDADADIGRTLGRRFDHVLVDEFQDVNLVQYRLLRHLAGRSRNLVVVGDDDQAIYGWRGAEVRLLLDFERDWPDARIIKLEENYRSSQIILDAAHAVVARNPERRDKRLFTRREGGEPILCHEALDERHEAAFVAQLLLCLQLEEGYLPGDFAIIYRTNAQSRVIEEALRALDVPYTVVGGTRFYDRAEVKDVLAYLRLCKNPADELALKRVINVPARGIGPVTVARLEAHARLGGVPLWQALQDALHDDELLSSGPRKKVAGLVRLLDELRQLATQVSLGELARAVLDRTGYLATLRVDEPEDEARRQNVLELLGSIEQLEQEVAELRSALRAAATALSPGEGAATEVPDSLDALLAPLPPGGVLTLGDYLERVALQMGEGEGASRGAQLMTAHAAKGLEFKVVFITGLEDGLFPSLRMHGVESEAEREARLAEERRLAYVALTRAKERLILTYAYCRRLYGQDPRIAPPSRFVREIPQACLAQTVEPDAAPVRGSPRPAADDNELRVERDDYFDWADATAERDDYAAAARWLRGRRRPARPPRIRAAGRDAGHGEGGDGGMRVEYDSDSGDGGMRVGQQVRHKLYGIGRIEEVSRHHLELALTVHFPTVGAKVIMARFVEPIGEGG